MSSPAGVSDGQLANENTFDTAFIARNGDSDTLGKLDLKNVEAVSGPNVLNIQRVMNSFASILGVTTGEDFDALMTFATSVVGANPQTVKARINAITAKFANTGGHDHSGVDGQGPKISTANLANFNPFRAFFTSTNVMGANGTSFDVSSFFTGKQPNGGDGQAGIVTDAPFNRVSLIDADNGTLVQDIDGNTVYGRLTFAMGVWTLSFYVDEPSIGTAYNLPSTNLTLYFLEVFSAANWPTIDENPIIYGFADITADVADASLVSRGLVSIMNQMFAGDKSFNDMLRALKAFSLAETVDSTTTGINATLPIPVTGIIRVTNPSLVSISQISFSKPSQFFTLVNGTGNEITLIPNAGPDAAKNLKVGSVDPIKVPAEGAVSLVRSDSESKWQVVGGTGNGTGGGSGPDVEVEFELESGVWAADDLASAQTFNTGITQPVAFLNPKGTPTLTGYNPATGVFTCPVGKAGKYLFKTDYNIQGTIASANKYSFQPFLFKTGSLAETKSGPQLITLGTGPQQLQITLAHIFDLEEGDEVQANFRNDSAPAFSTSITTNSSTSIEITRLKQKITVPGSSSSGQSAEYKVTELNFNTPGVQVGALTVTLPIPYLASGFTLDEILEGFFVKTETGFAGTGITSLKLDIGTSANPKRYIDGLDLLTVNSKDSYFTAFNLENIDTSGAAVNARLTAVGANLSVLTVGKVIIATKLFDLSTATVIPFA